MLNSGQDLPTSELPKQVPIFDNAYWVIKVRPTVYDPNRVSYDQLKATIVKTKVSLRGWDFPHLTNRQNEVVRGSTYFGGWSNFNNYEYWRFYQSGQFFFLANAPEAVRDDWRSSLDRDAHQSLKYLKPDWTTIGGYLSFINFLNTVTEIYEFAARLAQHLSIDESVEIEIALNNIDGFILMAESPRSWHSIYQWPQGRLGNRWTVASSELIAKSSQAALGAVIWFFHRFGWTDVSTEMLTTEQLNFYNRRI